MTSQSSKEDILNRVEKKAGDYLEAGLGNCTQSTVFVLQEEFQLGNVIPLKALTAIPGIALRGETCGAVVGALLALGMLASRDKPEGQEDFFEVNRLGLTLCQALEKEFGSLMCKHIHTKLCGKTYDFTDPAKMIEYVQAGGLKLCRAPVGKASRFVAEIILGEEA